MTRGGQVMSDLFFRILAWSDLVRFSGESACQGLRLVFFDKRVDTRV